MKTKILLTICILTTILFTGCGAKIEQSADTTTIEVGSDFSFVASDFFTSNKVDAIDEIIADISTVDTNTIGSYPVTVTYKKDTYAITVNVVDTVAPTIKLKEELPVVAEGDIVKAEDFVNVDDVTACKIFFVQSDNMEVEEQAISAGSNEFNIVAVDESNNRSDVVKYAVEIESVVEGTTLTQAEIDEYNATHSMKYNAEDGTVTSSSSGRVYEAVGQPGEDWRRMTDEQAKEILDKGEPEPSDYSTRAEYDEAYREYQAAGAELNGFDGGDLGGKWYYDYYEWKEIANKAASQAPDTEREIVESTGNEYHDTSGERFIPKGLKNK